MRIAIVLVAIACLVACPKSSPYPSNWPTAIFTLPEGMHGFKVLKSEHFENQMLTQETTFQFFLDKDVADAVDSFESVLELQGWKKYENKQDQLQLSEYHLMNSDLAVVSSSKDKQTTLFTCTYTHVAR